MKPEAARGGFTDCDAADGECDDLLFPVAHQISPVTSIGPAQLFHHSLPPSPAV